MSYIIKSNNSIFLDCVTCGELTDHYPVDYAGTLYLECEPCMLAGIS
jgi:hypothetical protein